MMSEAVQYIPFPPRVTAPSAVKVVEKEVLKVFTDPLFDDFKVYKTHSGGRSGFWEKDPSKVQKLIDAFKLGHNIKNACFYAGVREMAWYRFLEVYPEFRYIKEACASNTSFRTMNSFQEAIPKRPDLAFKYMEKRGDFNFETRAVDEEKPLQPTIVVPVQVNTTVNTHAREIEERSRVRLAERISQRSGGKQEASNTEMAGSVQG